MIEKTISDRTYCKNIMQRELYLKSHCKKSHKTNGVYTAQPPQNWESCPETVVAHMLINHAYAGCQGTSMKKTRRRRNNGYVVFK
jgi:hypothetical protein